MTLPNSKLVWFFLFVTVALLLLIGNFAQISAIHFEVDDLAANSLLIQDAKSFKLLVGHYSYLGFNHPGPAILYVLALGELILFDWFHIVPSAFSGQLVAISLYNAFWIVLLAQLLYKIFCSVQISALLLSVFLGISALINCKFYSGAWPPELFFFPFTVFLLSITLFQESRIDSLNSLALSMGFLVNGYASFVVLLGIMLFFGLAYNYWVYPGDNKILSKRYFIKYKKNLLVAMGIFLIFLIPIFIKTAIDFPGPLADYLGYGKMHKHHHSLESVRFVALYWGGLLPLVCGMLICFFCGLFYNKYAAKNEYSSIRSLWVTLILSTLMFLIYAKYGIDRFTNAYSGWFYYSVPALFISTVIVAILQRKISQKQTVILVISLFMVTVALLSYQNTQQSYKAESIHHRPELIKLYDVLNQNKENGRLVLNFDYGTKGYELYSVVIGIANYAKRHHNDLFCINNSWNIAFTKSAKCTKLESIRNKHFFLQHPDVVSDVKPVFQVENAAVYNVKRPNLTHSKFISTLEILKSPTKKILEHGWSDLELDYVWTEGKKSSMVFKLDKDFSGQIGLKLYAKLPKLDFIQEVTFYLNGQYIKKAQFSYADNQKLILLPVHSESELIHLELRVKNPVVTPFGFYQVKLPLGVALYGVAIKPNKKEHA